MMRPKLRRARTLWIVLGVLGGILALLLLVCCGGVMWFFSFPSTSPEAKEPFSMVSQPSVSFEKVRALEAALSPPMSATEFVAKPNGTAKSVGGESKLWVYEPEGSEKRPCVLIAPAGSTLLEGKSLAEGDQDEHLPYVQAGWVVIAYSLDGGSDEMLDEDPSFDDNGLVGSAFTEFQEASAGLVNARNAMEFALTHPRVDPRTIFVAGHSSAGTLAVLFAEHEPRVAGCVAYAPCLDLKARFPGPLVRVLESAKPGVADFLVRSSPRTHEDRLECPTLIFHAEDDGNVPIEDSRSFVKRLKKKGKPIEIREVPTGDHYDSMIEQGIPIGIEWIKSHTKQ
ncbi:MAG: prolyl oligopeptidase family serine peptidase [Pirellulales bacterium]